MDIACEVSQKPIAAKCFVSARRGVWVLPKYLNGEPADKAVMPAWVPAGLARWLGQRVVSRAIGNMKIMACPESQSINGASLRFRRVSNSAGMRRHFS